MSTTNYRITGTQPAADYNGRTLMPGELARIIGRKAIASFDTMMESFARDDNGHWVPREQQEDYEERYEAGRTARAYEPQRPLAYRAVMTGALVGVVVVIALVIAGRAG